MEWGGEVRGAEEMVEGGGGQAAFFFFFLTRALKKDILYHCASGLGFLAQTVKQTGRGPGGGEGQLPGGPG